MVKKGKSVYEQKISGITDTFFMGNRCNMHYTELPDGDAHKVQQQ